MNIAVVGTGYVGLVSGTCFAELGNNVVCVDIDADKIARLKKGEAPIYEPGLEELFQRNIDEDRLKFTMSLADGIAKAQVIFLALPTPPNEDGSADLSYILGVAEAIGEELDHYAVIVDKSTVPVGTAEKVMAKIQKNAATDFDVVSNPEFLKEGYAIDDFMAPDRIVVGASSDKARKVMKELYAPLAKSAGNVIFMDARSAEMTKYAANAFLATKISFINEIANLCEAVGANVDHVREGIGSDQRIGRQFLYPGIGYGGSCFPKDVRALNKTALDNDYEFSIIGSVMHVNAMQKKRILQKIEEHYKGDLKGKTFALWGLAFKPNTDDIREAPAIEIIEYLLARGARIKAFDPEATENIQKRFSAENSLQLKDDQYEALSDSNALIIATEWSEFRSPDFERMKKLLMQPVIFDGRNLYAVEDMEQKGFMYESIGRRKIGKKV